jgi:hypothetical protein
MYLNPLKPENRERRESGGGYGIIKKNTDS